MTFTADIAGFPAREHPSSVGQQVLAAQVINEPLWLDVSGDTCAHLLCQQLCSYSEAYRLKIQMLHKHSKFVGCVLYEESNNLRLTFSGWVIYLFSALSAALHSLHHLVTSYKFRWAQMGLGLIDTAFVLCNIIWYFCRKVLKSCTYLNGAVAYVNLLGVVTISWSICYPITEKFAEYSVGWRWFPRYIYRRGRGIVGGRWYWFASWSWNERIK